VEDPELLGGFDLLARVASPGKPPPPFRLPPLPRVAEPKGYPTAVPPEPPFAEPQPPDPSTLELACPTVGSAGKQLTIVGNLMPPHGDVPVLLRYAPPPSGTPVEHTAKTAPDGSFSDTITPDAKGSWSLTASWSGDADSLATQATCAFLVD
jgi:hypothetical protein